MHTYTQHKNIDTISVNSLLLLMSSYTPKTCKRLFVGALGGTGWIEKLKKTYWIGRII